MNESAAIPARPVPASEGLAGEFYSWHSLRELRLQRCKRCDVWCHPPVLTCPDCGSGELPWSRLSGRGTVFSWTVTHHPFHPAFLLDGPYVCAIISTDEGPRILSALRDVEPDAVTAGMRVVVDFEAVTADRHLAIFVADPEDSRT